MMNPISARVTRAITASRRAVMIQMGRARPVISPPSHTHSRFWATAWFASTEAS
jgi:hypothetical protein